MTKEGLKKLCKQHKERLLRIDYTDATNTTRGRFVRPYEIQSINQYHYLFATDLTHGKETIRQYRTDRIRSATPLPMTFTPVWEVKF